MFFKNLTVYRADRDWLAELPELGPILADLPLGQISANALECRGWSPVIRSIGDADQITLLRDYRTLPAGAVRRLAAERIAEHEARVGYRLGRKARLQITEEIATRMTPSVPVQRAELQAVIDRRDGWLLVNTATAARADELTQTLRNALGTLPVAPLTSDPGMASLMTRWLAGRLAPENFAFDDEAQLVSRDENRASVRYQHHNLDRDDVIDHLRDGKLVQRLALVWRERIVFVIDDRMAIRRLRFLDSVQIAQNRDDCDHDQAEEADLALMVGMLREMLADLATVTGAAPA